MLNKNGLNISADANIISTLGKWNCKTNGVIKRELYEQQSVYGGSKGGYNCEETVSAIRPKKVLDFNS